MKKLKTHMSVTMIIQSYHPHVGGAERQLAALAPLLKDKGIEINIVTRRYSGLPPFEVINEVPVYRIPAPGPKVLASLFFTMAALLIIKKLDPDVIHAHELLSPTTTAVAAKRWFGVPVVAKVLRGGMLGDINRLINRPFGPRRMTLFKQYVNAFIVISQEINNELLQHGIPSERCFYNPNGVDTKKFSPLSPAEKIKLRRKLDLPEGLLVIFTGRLSREKRIDQLVKLWPGVSSACAQVNLLVLGTGEEEKTLKQQAGDGIIFLGSVDDVSPYLQSADIFVLPSATEGLSNALLEGMSSGLPAIATKVGGAMDVITSNQNGLLIQPDNPEQLKKTLIKVLNDDDLRTHLGLEARKKIVDEYDIVNVATRLRNLYTQVVMKYKNESKI